MKKLKKKLFFIAMSISFVSSCCFVSAMETQETTSTDQLQQEKVEKVKQKPLNNLAKKESEEIVQQKKKDENNILFNINISKEDEEEIFVFYKEKDDMIFLEHSLNKRKVLTEERKQEKQKICVNKDKDIQNSFNKLNDYINKNKIGNVTISLLDKDQKDQYKDLIKAINELKKYIDKNGKEEEKIKI